MRVKDTALIGRRWGCRFEVVKGKGLVEIDDVDTTAEVEEEADVKPSEQELCDNRHLRQDQPELQQRLDKKEIGALRKSDNVTGSDIVGKLVEGSATFESKTGFSKAKYIRKKMQKHVFTVRVLQPTAFNMAQVYYSKHMPRIHRMRFDSLARLLTSSNVSANARVLCVDGCAGLVAGAILEKLAPAAAAGSTDGHAGAARGGMVIAYPDSRAAIDAVRWMNHSPSLLQHVCSCPLYYALAALEGKPAFFPGARANEKLKESGGRCSGNAHFAEHAAEEEVGSKQTQESSAVGPSHGMTRGPEEHDIQEPEEEEESQEQGQQDQQQHHQQQDQQQQHRKGHHEKQIDRSSRSIKRATVESVKSIAGPHGFDCIVIAGCISNISEVIARIIPLASSNASFCVYHSNVELLVEAQFLLQQRSDTVLCNVTGGWCREYQVLPDRTHPTMMMDSSNGALLTFYLAKSSVGKPFRAMTVEEQTASTKLALQLQQRASAAGAASKRERAEEGAAAKKAKCV